MFVASFWDSMQGGRDYQGYVEVSYALRSFNLVCPSRNHRVLK